MAKKKSKKQYKQNKRHAPPKKWTGHLYLLPVLFIVAVVPLIVYMRVIPLEGAALENWISDHNLDFFSYYKAVFFIAAAAAAAVLLAIYRDRLPIKKSAIYYPMGAYALLILLSSLFSEYRDISFFGFPDRYEGALVLLAYLAVAFVTVNFIKSKEHIMLVLGALTVSAAVAGVLGVFQFFGMNFFETEIGKALVFPAAYRHLADEVTFRFGQHRIFATFYNPNYVGSYTAMLLPLSVVICYYVRKKEHLWAALAFSCLMFAMLIGSASRAGLVGIFISFLAFLLFYYKTIIANWKRTVSLAIGFMLIFTVFNAVSGGRSLRSLVSIVTAPVEGEVLVEDELQLIDIVLDRKDLQFHFEDSKLLFAYADGIIKTKDEQGRELDYYYDEEEELLMFSEEPFQSYGFMIWEEENILGVNADGKEIYFTIDQEGFKIVNHRWEAVVPEPAETWGFEGRERLGSSRGYIWSRSIPLLKDTLFLGYGPDTYPVYFPQQEFFAKMLYMGNPYNVVDKPHNMYLQAAINTGILSLVAMVAMFTVYLFNSMRLYYRDALQNFYGASGLALFLAVLAYLVTGMFNDSLVSVSPVFWVLFGMGVACNHLYARNLEQG